MIDFFTIAIFAIPILFLTIGFGLAWTIARPWQRAFMSGGRVSFIEIIMTRVRGNPVNLIMDAYLSLLHSDVRTTYSDVEKSYIVHKSRIIASSDLVLAVQDDLRDAS